MKNVQILDCTLRDGGRIINCEFSDSIITNMTRDLVNARINIVEVGFLRGEDLVCYRGNSTFFTHPNQIEPLIQPKREDAIYTAFIDYKMYDFTKLPVYDGRSIDGIRVGFTKSQFTNELDEIKSILLIVKQLGYKLFIQTVNSLAYTDEELITLIQMVNEVNPYSFSIVDTYGAMYLEDLIHYYEVVDGNLNSNICIDIHSHNNFQSSFTFAQEIIHMSHDKREIILDATLNGMGKCAGNLNTEIIVDYLCRKKNYDYNLDKILDIIDRYIIPIKQNHEWGYSIPAFMAGIYKSHPNNIIYLTEKYRLNSKDIKYIISGIDEKTRQSYNYDNLERIYREYNDNQIDDTDTKRNLIQELQGKEILILAPGKSISKQADVIQDYIDENHPIVISVNFIPEKYYCNYHFYANPIHWGKICNEVERNKCILVSSLHENLSGVNLVNYASYIEVDSPLYDNSTIMLLNLMKELEVRCISLAGFDGLVGDKDNYVNHEFLNTNGRLSVADTNREVKRLYDNFKNRVGDKMNVKIITKSLYE